MKPQLAWNSLCSWEWLWTPDVLALISPVLELKACTTVLVFGYVFRFVFVLLTLPEARVIWEEGLQCESDFIRLPVGKTIRYFLLHDQYGRAQPTVSITTSWEGGPGIISKPWRSKSVSSILPWAPHFRSAPRFLLWVPALTYFDNGLWCGSASQKPKQKHFLLKLLLAMVF